MLTLALAGILVFVSLASSQEPAPQRVVYLGGNLSEECSGVAVDGSKSAYVVGQTFSPKFPQTNAAARKLMGGSDAFVTIITPLPSYPPPPPLPP